MSARAAAIRLALALGLGASSGCVNQRVTAVELIASGSDAGDAADAVSQTSGDAAPDSNDDAGGDGATLACADPAFTTSEPTGIWSDAGYFVFNNMWNTAAGPGPQTLYACSYHDWYVVSNQTDGAGAVKTYPNVQMNFNDLPLSSFHGISSTFAELSPHVGSYEDTFDIWLNGVALAGSTQIMIWVDNYKQTPLGAQVATTTVSGRTYAVWNTTDNSHITLVATESLSAGTLDLLAIFQWAIAQGFLPASSTLGQIDFGVEIVSTAGVNATFQFNDFSIVAN